MSLERKDVRFKLDADMHEALVAICEAKGLDIAKFIEALLVAEIQRLTHEASVITDRIRGQGTAGRARGPFGKNGERSGGQG